MAVGAVASVVLQKLTDLLKEESMRNEKLIVHQLPLEEIKKELENMGGYFMDAETKQDTDDGVKEWAGKCVLKLYSVEDAVESFSLRIARQRKKFGFLIYRALFLGKHRWKMKNVQSDILKLKNEMPDGLEDVSIRSLLCVNGNKRSTSAATQHSIDDTVPEEDAEEEDVGDHIEEKQQTKFYLDMEIAPTTNPMPRHSASATSEAHLPRSSMSGNKYRNIRFWRDASVLGERYRQARLTHCYSYEEEELDIVGFKQDVWDLLERLAKLKTDGEDSRIISIVGNLGSGKTTLARAVYGHRKIKESFECAWITITEESTTIDVLKKLLKQVGDSEGQGGESNQQTLQNKLFNCLKDKRYLIVLDNVWRADVWNNLKGAFPKSRNGSKIILTTREEEVARSASLESRPPRLKLTTDDSWELFTKKAGLEQDPDDDLKKRILEICNGVPLNIVLLGSLFSTKTNCGFDEWQTSLSYPVNWETKDILSLSYNDLPVHLKLCLLYLLLFPNHLDFDIPVRRLLRLWLAEGFVKPPGPKLRSDGSPKRCRLPGVVHDFLLPKAMDIKLFHLHTSGNHRDEFGIRRLIEYVNIKDCPSDPSQLKLLRSYLSFNSQKKDTPAKEVGNFLCKIIANGFSLLRVVDLEGVYKPSLPDDLGNFFNLRYLGLRWTFLDSLPQSVGDMPYLETIDVKRTYINTLPTSIWKLKRLRHLNLNGIRLDMPKHLQSNSLPRLLTLWGLS